MVSLELQGDLRRQRPMVGGHPNAGAIENLRVPDTCKRTCQRPIQWQKRSIDRERRLGGALKALPQKCWRQRKAAPRAPFIEVTNQDCRFVIFAEDMLADRAQLGQPQYLRERQVRTYQAKVLPFARKLGHNGPAMASPRKVDQIDSLHRDAWVKKHNDAQEPMALLGPSVLDSAMDIAQSGDLLHCCNVKQTGVRRTVLVRFLQDESIGASAPYLVSQNRLRAGWIKPSVIALAAVDVPADAAEARLRLCVVGHCFHLDFSLAPRLLRAANFLNERAAKRVAPSKPAKDKACLP